MPVVIMLWRIEIGIGREGGIAIRAFEQTVRRSKDACVVGKTEEIDPSKS